jgi:hypothetical protein
LAEAKKKRSEKNVAIFWQNFFLESFLFLEVKTRLLMQTEHMSKSMNVDSLLEQFLPNSLELNASFNMLAGQVQNSIESHKKRKQPQYVNPSAGARAVQQLLPDLEARAAAMDEDDSLAW